MTLLTALANQETNLSVAADGETVVSVRDIKTWATSGQVKKLRHYDSARLLTPDVQFVQRPLRAAIALRLLSKGPIWFEDLDGRRRPVSFPALVALIGSTFRDFLTVRALKRGVEEDLSRVERAGESHRHLDVTARPVYLKTDFVFGLKAGGSVAHTAGVLNCLDESTGAPLFLTSVRMPGIRPDIETVVLQPSDRFWELEAIPLVAFNETAYEQARAQLHGACPAFVYQRYCAYNFTGLKLATDLEVPLVLEYNGSEIWVNRNWGKPLAHEELAERIEVLNLQRAAVVVVVSEPMRTELAGRGVDVRRVLVNPNGVDPTRYSPDIDGSAVRTSLGLDGKLVIGFIGTFGRWHGAEVLVDAFAEVVARRPDLRADLRLLLVGDGQTMPLVQDRIREHGLGDLVVLTGLVAHDEGPKHLAACDIFASPHVPNADGSQFFGSPTKLFEYMATGRGIVASDLDQIGEVLEHGKTAWLVEPGSVSSLAEGLLTLVDDPALRASLGAAAREVAARDHSWSAHTRRIVESLVAVSE